MVQLSNMAPEPELPITARAYTSDWRKSLTARLAESVKGEMERLQARLAELQAEEKAASETPRQQVERLLATGDRWYIVGRLLDRASEQELVELLTYYVQDHGG